MIESALWGAPEWATAAAVLFGLGALALLWSYARSPSTSGVRLLAGTLKVVGLGLLALFLVEPMLRGTRPRTGANLFVVAADNSQSLTIHDAQQDSSRGAGLQAELLAETEWQTRLADDFDVRRFEFDTQLRGVKDFTQLDFSGEGSAIGTTLSSLAKRFRGLPTGGIILFTDGNSTDQVRDDIAWDDLPPVYPVLVGSDDSPQDISVEEVTSTQTNFDAAPVNVRAELRSLASAPRKVLVRLLDERGTELQTQTLDLDPGDETTVVRFDLRPTDPAGVSFYAVDAVAADQEDAAAASEATLANNTRQFLVDRGGGPYRVLYVCGRPNWEFKFLRRALADDDQIELVGLIRIAHRQARFDFRRKGESRNTLFENFDQPDADTQERHDEPVLARIGTTDDVELRDGFPKTADELYKYDAIILDDIEADFFSQDQKSLVEGFVSRRGGGFLMLGGTESFAEGKYARTPIGNLLPVYLERTGSAPQAVGEEFRLSLTREGWLQPWVRLRKTEAEDRQRLAGMPEFKTLNHVGLLKPGATPLANVVDEQNREQPALIAQRYGRGRSAALVVGDLWRWGMRRQGTTDDDLFRAWRQMARWLVADVPQRVEVEVMATDGSSTGVDLAIRVADEKYLPLENASLTIEVTGPDGQTSTVRSEAGSKPGDYRATYIPRTPGIYRATVQADNPDGSPVGERTTGWVVQPLADEFQRLQPNRALAARIAESTGGEVLELDDLDRFVRSLESREMPLTEPWVRPLWYNPWTFTLAILCLCGEWGLRRWRGLA